MDSPNNQAELKAAALEEEKETEAKKRRRRRIIVWIIIILLILFFLYFLFRMFLFSGADKGAIEVNQTKNTFDISQKIVIATSTTEAAKRAQAIAASENFEMLQINLEGSGTNVFDFGETEIFTINNVASELYTAKEGDKTEIRAVISCQTNRRSYVEAEYYKSGEKDKKVFKDTYFGFNHILIIPALDPDSVYRYSVSATDSNQIKIYSEQYVFYTGAGNISLVDVLSNAVQKVFGWTLGK